MKERRKRGIHWNGKLGGALVGIAGALFLIACGKEEPSVILGEEEMLTASLGNEDDSFKEETTKERKEEEPREGEPEVSSSAFVYVYLCGQVKNPGVYTLSGEKHLCDAIDLAGGLTDEAADMAVNLAQELEDGKMYYFPSLEEFEGMKAFDTEASSGSPLADNNPVEDAQGRINLNLATEADLMKIPGIGASKAKKILDYRNQNGNFTSIEEIKNVSGIKEGTYTQIKDYIYVN